MTDMNDHERLAWRRLIDLGAREIDLGGKPALDLLPIRIRNRPTLEIFCSALVEVVGHSGANRRHHGRTGAPVFVVTDDRGAG